MNKMTVEQVKEIVFNYPTYAELYHRAALDALHKLEFLQAHSS